jgi:hypothetical protein
MTENGSREGDKRKELGRILHLSILLQHSSKNVCLYARLSDDNRCKDNSHDAALCAHAVSSDL